MEHKVINLKRRATAPAQHSPPSAHSGDDAIIPAAEVALLLGVSMRTLANWRWRRTGPPFMKYGGDKGPVRYRLSDLRAWQEAHRRGPTSSQTEGGDHG